MPYPPFRPQSSGFCPPGETLGDIASAVTTKKMKEQGIPYNWRLPRLMSQRFQVQLRCRPERFLKCSRGWPQQLRSQASSVGHKLYSHNDGHVQHQSTARITIGLPKALALILAIFGLTQSRAGGLETKYLFWKKFNDAA